MLGGRLRHPPLRRLYQPLGAAPRGQIKLSPKTILNVHTDLSGLWTWGVEEGFVSANIVRTIAPPDPKAPVVETLTKEEIDALLGACDRGKTWKTRQLTASDRPTADRDRALILLLLDIYAGRHAMALASHDSSQMPDAPVSPFDFDGPAHIGV